MTPALILTGLHIEQEQVCVVTPTSSPDCEEHDHLPGARRVVVVAEPDFTDSTLIDLADCVGRRFVLSD